MSYNSPTSVVIPPHIKNWLIEKAQKEERSFSEILRRILKKEYADDIKAAEKKEAAAKPINPLLTPIVTNED